MRKRAKHIRPTARVREDAPLSVPMHLRMAEDEAELVRQAADLQGLSVAQFLRGTAISASVSVLDSGGAAVP